MNYTRTTESIFHQLGAWLFSALILISATEMIHASHAATAPGTGHSSAPVGQAAEALYARAEGRTEAARMPEEYDVGLKAPIVSGY